jgi:hypothetical protein
MLSALPRQSRLLRRSCHVHVEVVHFWRGLKDVFTGIALCYHNSIAYQLGVHTVANPQRIRQLRYTGGTAELARVLIASGKEGSTGSARKDDYPKYIICLHKPLCLSLCRRLGLSQTHHLPIIRTRYWIERSGTLRMWPRPNKDLVFLDWWHASFFECARKVCVKHKPRIMREAVNPSLRLWLSAAHRCQVMGFTIVFAQRHL